MHSWQNLAWSPRVQRRRVRWQLGPWILEGAIGKVPQRLGLRELPLPIHHPRWQPEPDHTLYARLHIRRA
jgi:hypothetical protein